MGVGHGIGEYRRFLEQRVFRDKRFLANIKHPERGYKVSLYELRLFIGPWASLGDFIAACQVLGYRVRRVSKKSVVVWVDGR